MWRSECFVGRGRMAALVVATALSIVAGLTRPDIAFARRRETVQVLNTTPIVTASETSIQICADEKYTIEVKVEEEVLYRWRNDAPGVTHTSHRPLARNVTVNAQVSGSNASIAPASAPIRVPRSTATFDITGKDPGTTNVFISVTGSNLQAVISVKVDECAYEITTDGHWFFGVGFKPDVFATLWHLRLRRVRDGVYIGTGAMRNWGLGTPVSGCVPRITAPDSQVTAKVEIVQGQYGPKAHVNITYSPVGAGMTVTCPRVPGKGESKDTATIQTIDMDMRAWVYEDVTHVPGHLAQNGIGTASSNTFVGLYLIRP